MEHSIIEQQMALEAEMVGEGVERYAAQREKRGEAATKAGVALLRHTVEPLIAGITEWVEKARHGKARRQAFMAPKIEEVGIPDAAYLTQRTCIDAIFAGATLTAAAKDLGDALVRLLEYRLFHAAHPRLTELLIQQVQSSPSPDHRNYVLARKRRKKGIPDIDWSEELKIKLGLHLIGLSIATTGLVEIRAQRRGTKDVSILLGTDKAREWLNKRHEHCALLNPVYMPMVMPPIPWESPTIGGYVSVKLSMVKCYNKANLALYTGVEMPRVYESLKSLLQNPKM